MHDHDGRSGATSADAFVVYRWLLATSRAPVSDSCALGTRHASQICKDSEAVGSFSKAKQGFGKYLPSRYCPIYLDFHSA